MILIGHIKLDRKILAWEWYTDANVFRLFLHLLLTANHKDGKWQGHEIKRGQLITGLDKLSQSTGLSVMQIRTCFDKLKSTGEITIKVTSKFRTVTICKYDTYQSFEKISNNQFSKQIADELTNDLTGEQQAGNKLVTANNNDNNDNNDNKVNFKGENFQNDFVCYDVENYLLATPEILEKIAMKGGYKKEEILFIKDQLHLYHLWLEKKENYPFGKKAARAGFESWLLNSKKYNKLNGSTKPTTTGRTLERDRP